MVIQYAALPVQFRFLRSRAQFAGLFGGVGSGKSHVGCFWALTKALRNPRCLGLIGANSYRQLRDATLRTFDMFLRHYHVPYTFHSSDMAFRLENGAEILCRSMENYDLLRGIELGWFYLDELRETRLEAWQVVKGRLRSQDVDAREGRVTSSPNGFDWMYEEFVRKPSEPATAEAYANHAVFFARTQDNKHLPPDYIAALVASYDPLLVAQELDGRFVNTTQGRIYHAFDREVHVTPEAELVPGQPIVWSLDFNVTPMTAVIAQWDLFVVPPSGGPSEDRVNAGLRTAIRVVDEIWLTNSNTLAMCEALGQWLAEHELVGPSAFPLPVGESRVRARGGGGAAEVPHPTPLPQGEGGRGVSLPQGEGGGSCSLPRGERGAGETPRVPILVYGDAAGRSRSTAGTSDYAIIREFFPTAALCVGTSNPPRRDRYNAVNAALRTAGGRVRLRIHPRCVHLIADLERTTYQAGSSEPDHSDPLRGHISDALGYLVARVMPAGRAALAVGRW